MEFFNYRAFTLGLLLAIINLTQAMEMDEYHGINEIAVMGSANSHRRILEPNPMMPSTVLPKNS